LVRRGKALTIDPILVVGATGLIGAPVAWRLVAEGHHVRLLVRDAERASAQLGGGFDYIEGSVRDGAAVDRAVQGMDGVHVSLGVEDPAQLEPVEHHGTAAVAAAAARCGPLHPVCAEDFATKVARAFATPAAANRDFYIHGPEVPTLHQALGIYRQIARPGKRLITVPLPVMSIVDRLFMGGKLSANLQIMHVLARRGEQGDPNAANELPGTPTTTVQAWCHTQVTAADVQSDR
jgi:uncharacterized protein YbjT (DUF2867 family)